MVISLAITTKRGATSSEFFIREIDISNQRIPAGTLSWYCLPKENPYSLEGVPVVGMFQPKVTFVATFAKDDAGGGILEYNLQTSVSLRIYN